jgi:uncharacterized membrane protein
MMIAITMMFMIITLVMVIMIWTMSSAADHPRLRDDRSGRPSAQTLQQVALAAGQAPRDRRVLHPER